jgi:hypothetical protein
MASSGLQQTPSRERRHVAPFAAAHRDRERPTLSRVRRVALGAALVCLIPAGVSFLAAATKASNSGLGIRTVEWLRDNGARGFVNRVEAIYYSLTAPAKGGATLRVLPQQPNAVDATKLVQRPAVHYYRPPPVHLPIQPSLPGEGVWRATYSGGGARPPVLVTSFRSDPAYPRMVAGVAWIDHTRTQTWLYPGRQEPSVSLPRGPMEIPLRLRSRVVATFNSGFKLKDSGGGVALGGHAYASLMPGVATFVRYRDGRYDVKAWRGGPDPGPDVVFARQNLPLIVNHARPNPNLSDGPEWGATLGNAVRVWRSGVGVDRHHNIVYAAANQQTVGSLAEILIRAGAVRAMELDINSYWTNFISYRRAGARGPANLLLSMTRPANRYLTPDDRDFFAVYVR